MLGFSEGLERTTRLEDRQQHPKERFQKLEERMVKVEEALGRRLGRRFENLVREVYRDLLVEHGIEPARVERLRYVDVDGRYLAPGSPIEVDVYVHDRRT